MKTQRHKREAYAFPPIRASARHQKPAGGAGRALRAGVSCIAAPPRTERPRMYRPELECPPSARRMTGHPNNPESNRRAQ